MNPCCCYCTSLPLSSHYRSRSLKMKSARFKKASEDESRGKKRERYHEIGLTTDRQKDIAPQSWEPSYLGPPERYPTVRYTLG